MNNQTNCCNALGKLKIIRICLIFILPWDSNSLGLIFDLLGQVFNSKQRVPKRFDTPYGFRNPYMLPSTDTYSWHFNVRCMQMDSLIFHSSNYIASRQARSAKVSWNVEFLKILFPYPSAFSNKNEKRIWWQVRRRGRASREGKNVLIQFFLFLKPKPLVMADWQICAQ